MKKLLAAIIAVMLCASACAPKEPAMDAAISDSGEGQAAPAETDAPVGFISEEDGKNINAMLPIMDSIMRSIGIDSDTKYDAKSDELIWSVLYLTGVNWGMSIEPETAEPTVTTDEQGYVTVAASTMEDYAAAAFGGERSIPKIAASLAESVTFDNSSKAYRLAPSDMGDTVAGIESITPDGSAVKVSTGLYLGSGERLGGMVFTLEKCDTAGQFKYCVTAAVNENELGIYQWKDVKLNSEDSLSADGKADSVRFTVVQDKDDNVTVKFNIDGKESADELGPLSLGESPIHIGDTIVGDGYTELYVTGDKASDDYVTFIYRVHNGEVKKAFITGTVQNVYGNGGISVETTIDILGTHDATCDFMLSTGDSGDDFAFARSSDYTVVYQNFSEAWDYFALKLSRDGLKLTMGDGSAAEGRKGEKFLIMGTDMQSYADLMAEDGTTSKINIQASEDEYDYLTWKIDGVPESEWFEELAYAG